MLRWTLDGSLKSTGQVDNWNTEAILKINLNLNWYTQIHLDLTVLYSPYLCMVLNSKVDATVNCWCLLQDISPTNCSLRRILSGNKSLQNLILNCRWLDDSSVEVFAKESIRELVLLRCTRFSSYIFTAIGKSCPKLR